MWVPLLVVVFKVLFGADIYLHAPQVLGILAASGAACAGVLLAFLHWLRHPRHRRLAQAFDDHSVGGSLRRAQAVLDEIARFEEE